MASIKIKFRPSANEGREGKIYYQVIHERVVRQWYSDYRIYADEWDSATSMLVLNAKPERREHLEVVKEKINWDMERFRKVISEYRKRHLDFTADEIIEEFVNRRNQQSFFTFMERVIVRLKELGKQRTSETYKTALNSFRNFRGGEELDFNGMNSEMMETYEAYLRGHGLIPNSISFHMRILRAVYNRAVEKHLIDDCKPFRHVYTGVDKTVKRAIDVEMLRKLKEAYLGDEPNAEYARDIFLLSFYLRGMSFVDMSYLKKSDLIGDRVCYRRRKTGQKLMVKWTREMQEIVDRYPRNDTEYLLPIITSMTSTPYCQYRKKQFKINRGLKEVAAKIGLEMPLTLYCSRHSWASIAKAKGVPIGVISDGLGHDNEQTTQIYLSTLDTSAVDRANALLINLL